MDKKTMMMMMMTRRSYLVVLSLFLSVIAAAQEKDFGIWYGISAEHKLTKNIEVSLSANIRTFNNAGKIEEAFLEGGAEYNFNKILAIAGSYRLTENIENNDSYYFQHKWMFDIKGEMPIKNFNFTCRLRMQTRFKTYIENKSDEHPDYTGRIKLKAEFKTPTFPVDPYVYVESFCPMFSNKSGSIGKNRFSAGLDFSIIRHHSVELEYIYQRDYQPHLSDINILSLNYNIKF